jgi:hypothetical protein
VPLSSLVSAEAEANNNLSYGSERIVKFRSQLQRRSRTYVRTYTVYAYVATSLIFKPEGDSSATLAFKAGDYMMRAEACKAAVVGLKPIRRATT